MPKNASFNLLEATGNITFTVIPNNFLDTIAPTLNPSELRVMLYIYRHTLGFQKLTDTISYDQFLHGMVSHNQRCLDKGAGVSRNSLVAALASLEKKLLIRRQHNGKYGPVTIRLQTAALHGFTEAVPPNHAAGKPAVSNETTLAGMAQPGEPASANTGPEKTNRAATTRHTEAQKLGLLTGTAETNHLNQDQVLTEVGNCEAQKLDFTKETGIQKQNKPNRAAVAGIRLASKQITASVPGVSAADAARLVEQAFANGRDQAYISRVVHHVTNNPAIRVPAAVLTTLVKANEDRVSPVNPPVHQAGSRRPTGQDYPAVKNYKTGKAFSGERPSNQHRIDFNKYSPSSSDLGAACSEPSCYSSPFTPEKRVESGRQIDPHLKYSLQEFNSRLAVYVRHLAVDGTILKIGFFGTKRFPAAELAPWLSRVKIYYPEVTAIQVVDQIV